nr:MAG TPA: hypothetical protein [Bacteriophage sp.]
MVDRKRAQIEPFPADPEKLWNDRAMRGRTCAVRICLYSIVGAFVALVKLCHAYAYLWLHKAK